MKGSKESAIFLIKRKNKQMAWILYDDLIGTDFYLNWQNIYMDFP